jgi:hypothetical protein
MTKQQYKEFQHDTDEMTFAGVHAKWDESRGHGLTALMLTGPSPTFEPETTDEKA